MRDGIYEEDHCDTKENHAILIVGYGKDEKS
jgi:C1A family cysteine protease